MRRNLGGTRVSVISSESRKNNLADKRELKGGDAGCRTGMGVERAIGKGTHHMSPSESYHQRPAVLHTAPFDVTDMKTYLRMKKE